MKKLIVLAALWLPCGYLNWGLTLGWFTHKYPYMSNVDAAAGMAAFGPFGTPVVLLEALPSPHWLTKPKTTEERWQEFLKEGYGVLGRDYFDQKYN